MRILLLLAILLFICFDVTIASQPSRKIDYNRLNALKLKKEKDEIIEKVVQDLIDKSDGKIKREHIIGNIWVPNEKSVTNMKDVSMPFFVFMIVLSVSLFAGFVMMAEGFEKLEKEASHTAKIEAKEKKIHKRTSTDYVAVGTELRDIMNPPMHDYVPVPNHYSFSSACDWLTCGCLD